MGWQRQRLDRLSLVAINDGEAIFQRVAPGQFAERVVRPHSYGLLEARFQEGELEVDVEVVLVVLVHARVSGDRALACILKPVDQQGDLGRTAGIQFMHKHALDLAVGV